MQREKGRNCHICKKTPLLTHIFNGNLAEILAGGRTRQSTIVSTVKGSSSHQNWWESRRALLFPMAVGQNFGRFWNGWIFWNDVMPSPAKSCRNGFCWSEKRRLQPFCRSSSAISEQCELKIDFWPRRTDKNRIPRFMPRFLWDPPYSWLEIGFQGTKFYPLVTMGKSTINGHFQ